MKFSSSLLMTFAAVLFCSAARTLGAFIEVPDELLDDAEVSFVGQDLVRARRQITGGGSEKQGSISGQGSKVLFEDSKTQLVGTASGQTSWMKGMPSQHQGMARLDGQQQLFTDGKNAVHANGFLQRNVGTGMRPHDSQGAGIEFTRTLASGKDGRVEAYGGFQRQWNTPNRNNYNAGVRWRF